MHLVPLFPSPGGLASQGGALRSLSGGPPCLSSPTTPAWSHVLPPCPNPMTGSSGSHRAAGAAGLQEGAIPERPAAVKDYLRLKLAAEPNEVFAIVFLNSMHEVLAYEPMFRGTIHSTSVHARPIVQRALELNAAAVIFSPTPFGLHGAVERGPCVDPNAEGRVVADRREGAGSPHRRPGHAVLVRGIRPAVATASAPDPRGGFGLRFSWARDKQVCGQCAMRIVCWGRVGFAFDYCSDQLQGHAT